VPSAVTHDLGALKLRADDERRQQTADVQGVLLPLNRGSAPSTRLLRRQGKKAPAKRGGWLGGEKRLRGVEWSSTGPVARTPAESPKAANTRRRARR
jgi:hypothetical protein